MKRSGPLPRRTPLTSTTGLTPGAPLPRTGNLARTPMQPTRRKPAAPKPVLDIVRERDGDGCVGCGRQGVPLETHHRLPKGMGGSKLLDHPANLIRLCGLGNVSGCHGRAHRYRIQAEASGLMVPEGQGPASWPLHHAVYGWVLLGDEGNMVPVDETGEAR